MTCPARSQSRDPSRIILRLLFALFIPALLLAFPASGAIPAGEHEPVPGIAWGPWITGTTPTGTIIHVKTVMPGNVTIQYGREEDFLKTGTYRNEVSDSSPDLLHHIALGGLSPATRYHYRVFAGGKSTGDCHFLTFPFSGPVSFIVYGDSRDQSSQSERNERHLEVAEMIAREENVSFVLHTGDILTDSRNLTDWDRFFASGGILLANTTFVPVMGNHEQDSPIWEEVFSTAPAYSFNCGPAHVTVLNSNDNVWSRLGCETAWLRNDLESGKPWKFAALHHPLYSSEEKHIGGWTNLRNAWEGFFIGKNVSAVFQGHVHVYERDVAGGVTYITEGRGGSPFYILNETKIPSHAMSRENSLGYSRVDLDPLGGVALVTVVEGPGSGDGKTAMPPDSMIVERFNLSSPGAQPGRRGSPVLSDFRPFHSPLF